MPSRILFIAEEAGAAAFLFPVWEQLFANEHDVDIKIILGLGANAWLKRKEIGIYSFLQKAIICPKDLKGCLNKWIPDLVFSSASGSKLERVALEFAKGHGSRTAQFIDTWNGYHRRFVVGKELMLPECILVIDECAVKEAISDGLPAERLLPVGHPAWEQAPSCLMASRNDVMFINQPIFSYYERQLGYDEHDAWEIVVQAKNRFPSVFEKIWYIEHPDTPMTERKEFAGVTSDSSMAIRLSGTVLGMFSSLMVDAFLSGSKVISLQPGLPSRDMSFLSRQGYISRVSTVDELVSEMSEPREPSTKMQSLIEALDGSCQRVERFLVN